MRLLTEELREQLQEALGKLTKQIVDWERRDIPDFNRSVEIFSELQVTLLEILSIIEARDKETLKAVGELLASIGVFYDMELDKADSFANKQIEAMCKLKDETGQGCMCYLPSEILETLLRGEMPEEVKD